MNSKAFLIAAAAICLVAGAAHAASKPSQTVRTNDLDLSRPRTSSGSTTRVYEAASVVCGGGPLVSFVGGPPAAYLTCRDAAADAALSRFHSPLVLALRTRVREQREAAPQ